MQTPNEKTIFISMFLVYAVSGARRRFKDAQHSSQ